MKSNCPTYLNRTCPPAPISIVPRQQVGMTDGLRREVIQAYLATVSFLDAHVGRGVDALNRLGLSDDTMIVFTSDHGYILGDHGLWQKNVFLNAPAGFR